MNSFRVLFWENLGKIPIAIIESVTVQGNAGRSVMLTPGAKDRETQAYRHQQL
jgi:hypothetical protein